MDDIKFDKAGFLFTPRDFLCCNPRNWLFRTIKPDYDTWMQNVKDKNKAVKCFERKDWDLFRKCVKKDLCEYDEDSRCMFKKVCHPQAGISRKSHYKEIWESFLGKSL